MILVQPSSIHHAVAAAPGARTTRPAHDAYHLGHPQRAPGAPHSFARARHSGALARTAIRLGGRGTSSCRDRAGRQSNAPSLVFHPPFKGWPTLGALGRCCPPRPATGWATASMCTPSSTTRPSQQRCRRGSCSTMVPPRSLARPPPAGASVSTRTAASRRSPSPFRERWAPLTHTPPGKCCPHEQDA